MALPIQQLVYMYDKQIYDRFEEKVKDRRKISFSEYLKITNEIYEPGYAYNYDTITYIIHLHGWRDELIDENDLWVHYMVKY